jgi:hypothetical protein
MKRPIHIIALFPFIVVTAILSAIVGMVAVAAAFVIASALLQLLGELIGFLSGSVPWQIVIFFRDGIFVFELSESAFSAMNFLARWVGLVGGGVCGIYLFLRRHRKRSTIST